MKAKTKNGFAPKVCLRCNLEFDWTRVVVTFIKSFFGDLSRKSQSRRANGDSS